MPRRIYIDISILDHQSGCLIYNIGTYILDGGKLHPYGAIISLIKRNEKICGHCISIYNRDGELMHEHIHGIDMNIIPSSPLNVYIHSYLNVNPELRDQFADKITMDRKFMPISFSSILTTPRIDDYSALALNDAVSVLYIGLVQYASFKHKRRLYESDIWDALREYEYCQLMAWTDKRVKYKFTDLMYKPLLVGKLYPGDVKFLF